MTVAASGRRPASPRRHPVFTRRHSDAVWISAIRRFVPYVAVLVAVAVVVSLVVASRGVQNQVMDLHNSGVWVTNDARGLWGRVNRSASALDVALSDRERESLSGYLDVFQDGEAVVGWTLDESRLFAVDTRDGVASPDPPVSVVKLSAVGMGGGVLATISADKGEVRTTPYAVSEVVDVSGLGVDRPVAAQLEVVSGLESGVDVAVDGQGRVFAGSASGDWVVIDEAGEVTYGSVNQSLRSVAVSIVGGIGVMVDTVSGDVFLTNGVHVNVGTGVVPQQPGVDGTRVILATPTGLTGVAVSNGSLTTVCDVPAAGGRMIARPVVVGSVVYGAWGGVPGRWVRVDGVSVESDVFPADGSVLSRPAFRVNRGSVVLNDMASGAVFDMEEKWAIEDWEDVAPESTQVSGESSKSDEDSPQASDDHVWARAGRLAVVHVLDNDTNPGTGIVAITDVNGQDASRVVISPDGQTLAVDIPDGQTDDLMMTYTITNRALDSDENDEMSSANVTISVRPQNENNLPYQMGEQGTDETVPDFTVPSAGFLTIAPAGSWRDPDSDAVSVVSATVGDRVLPVTAEGLIQYRAQASAGQITEKVDYLASDGFGQMVPGTVYVKVMPDSAVQAISPIAMPDSVRGVAGEQVVFYPLDNDVPGSDPLDKQAKLTLATPVGTRVGMDVSTDLLSGAVTITAENPGAYFLDYTASFGAGFDSGKIRVDIVADDQLVAMPDTAVIHGTVPVVVDLLSNDRDPRGSVLTVTSATPENPDGVRVGIIQGRWLRIDPQSSVPMSAPTIVTYQVTNGRTSASGQVSVTLLPAVGTDHVSVVDDIARVRVGDVTTIPVLDNDRSESGEPLVLNDNVASMAAGQLYVDDPTAPAGQETLNVGQAFVDGNRIRYEAPTSGDGKRVRIVYQAGVVSSSPSTGYVWVDVVPEPVTTTGANPGLNQPATMTGNNVPTPVTVEARTIIGDAVRIPIGIYGQDPDGDSVTVAGLRTPPKYGRVVEFGADYLMYESYPDVDKAWEDSFQFYVQDRFGAIGIGTARIGLSAPHEVPPPLGVDDVVTAQPNVSVTVFPTSNDVVPIGADATRIVLDDPTAAQVDQDSASVVTVAPAENAPAVSLGYHLDAGVATGTSAQIMVRSQVGYLNPPNVSDHAAENIDNGVASVDVLEDAWDVDGPDSAIHIISVGAAGTFDGATVSVPVLDRGQVVPYVVEDGDGAQAMAVVFVPSLTDGRPTLISGGLIRMDHNGSEQVDLNDYIESPRNQSVHLTLASQVWTAPTAYLDVSVESDDHVTLRARGDYVGPAALTVEVRDSLDATDPTALTGVVTIPVQIGAATPVLWCPDEVLEVVQGGVPVSMDVAEVCHAWMPTQTEIDALVYNGSWALGGDNITITGRDQGSLPSDVLTLQALTDSRPGADSILVISVAEYEVSDQMRVRVIAAPRPTISVSSVADVQAATTVEIPVTVTSPMPAGIQNIVSVTQTSGPAGNVNFNDRTIQVTPDASSHGMLVFDVVGSDISDDSRTDRQVTGTFSVEVFGVPDPPSPPQPGTQLRSGSAVVTFTPNADNGAPILGYEVRWEGGSLSCDLNTTCEIPHLNNGTAYRFQARAINKAGPSEWSEVGPDVTPNAIPGAVMNFTTSNPGCGSMMLTWKPPQGEGTTPTMYYLTWDDQTSPVAINGADVTYTPAGLDNNRMSTFKIVAENEAGIGQQPVTVKGQSSCKPVWPEGGVTAEPHAIGDIAQMTVTWPAADPQGPAPVTYQVTRTGPDGTKKFAPTTELTLGDNSDEIAFDGQTYTYHVTAANATGGNGHTSDEISGSFQAVSVPAAWSTVGGADAVKIEATGVSGQIQVSVVKFPNFHDSSGRVTVTVGSQTLTLTPGDASRKVDGFVNGTDVTASFTACNAQNTTKPCNEAQSVSLAGGPFAPLTAPVITAEQGTGRNVCVTARGDGNGRGATLVVTGSNGIGEVYRKTTLSVNNLCVDALTWDTDVTFTAHLESAATTPTRANSPDASDTTHSAIGVPDDWAAGSVSAAPTVIDGVVQSGDVTLSVAMFPKPNGGTLAVSYTMVGTSTSGAIPLTGSTRVRNLTNGQIYFFSVVASNGQNQNTPVTVSTASYGPLDAPSLTVLDGDDVKACVQAVTPISGTNGATASLVIKAGETEVYKSSVQRGVIDSGRQCWSAGDYNKDLEFTAQLITGENLYRGDSPVTTKTARSSIGTPKNLSASNIVWAATGRSQEISLQLTGTLPAHNGGPSDHLEVQVTGMPVPSSSAPVRLTLTQASPSAVVTGFENGTPTTLTFTPCNAENCGTPLQVTVTSVGELGTPQVVSSKPEADTTKADKTVCAQFSADANGARAKLVITNDVDPSKTSEATGIGRVVPKELCVDAGGAQKDVTFTATFTDEADLEYNRKEEKNTTVVTSAKDAGPMSVKSTEFASFTYENNEATDCKPFEFDPNGGDAEGSIEITPTPASGENWYMEDGTVGESGIWVFPVPAGAILTQTICGTVPADGRRIFVKTHMVDKSGFNRPDYDQTWYSDVKNLPFITMDPASSRTFTPTGTKIKQVCATFTAHGGDGFPVTLTVTPSNDPDLAKSDTGDDVTVDLCVDAGAPSQTVTFTASVKDESRYNRTYPDLVKEVTSGSGDSEVTGGLDSAVAGNGTVTVKGWALDPDTAQPIDVQAYILKDGESMTASGWGTDGYDLGWANVATTEISSTYPTTYYGTNHGFNKTFSINSNAVNKHGEFTIYVFAISSSPNAPGEKNIVIGTQTITLP